MFLFENVNKYITNEIYLKLAIDSILLNPDKYKKKVFDGVIKNIEDNKNVIYLLNSIKNKNVIEHVGNNNENIGIDIRKMINLHNLKVLIIKGIYI